MSLNWEVVGKAKVNTKNQKRAVLDKMPKQNRDVAPLELTDTMFKAFEEKTRNHNQPLQDRSDNQSSPKANKKPKKPKKQPVAPKYKYRSFQEAIEAVSDTSLREKAEQSHSRFPKNPNICLKEIASYLNDIISCPDGSAALMDKEFSYPLSNVPKPVYNLLRKWFGDEVTDTVKELLFEHCIKAMLDCIIADQPCWGYRICIQALAHNSPRICCSNLGVDLEKISNIKNVPKRCLAYMWALGQVGVKDPHCGMTVWLQVLLPMMTVKSLAPFVVNYLDNLITTTKDPVARLSGCVDADNFLAIMKCCFDQTTGLAANLREQMRELYRTIRSLATGNAKLRVLLFQKYLETPVDETSNIRPELLEVVFECMQSNHQCFSAWREMYVTTLPQTRVLLEFLENRWEESLNKLPRNQFKETVRAFHNTNLDAATQSSNFTSVHDFKAVNEICRNMHHKLTQESERSLSRCNHVVVPVLVALLAVGVGIFVYDVHTHGGVIEQSSIYKTLDKSGTLNILKQIWAKISLAYGRILNWLEANLPYFWSRLKETLGPYLTCFGNWISGVFSWVIEVTEGPRGQLVEWTKESLIMADDIFRRFLVASGEKYEAIRPNLIRFWAWLEQSLSSIYALFTGEMHWCCVRDAVVSYAQAAYAFACAMAVSAWSYALHLVKLVGDYVAGENMQ